MNSLDVMTNTTPRRAVLSDLDSTLANVFHREHLAALETSDHSAWIAYSKACVADEPVLGVARALRLFKKAGYEIIIVSGRNEEAREETIFWLNLHDIPFDGLRLRRDDDISHNGQYKVAYIKSLIEEGITPVLMFEDHVGVAVMIEEAGVPTVSVAPRYTDGVGSNFNAIGGNPV